MGSELPYYRYFPTSNHYLHYLPGQTHAHNSHFYTATTNSPMIHTIQQTHYPSTPPTYTSYHPTHTSYKEPTGPIESEPYDLLLSNPYLEQNQSLILHWCINTRNPTLLTQTLRSGISPEHRDHTGRTPLHLAVLYNQEDSVRALLEVGADVRTRDNNNRTPLHEARAVYARTNNAMVVWLLLENEGDRGYRDDDGVPLLHLAVRFGHLELVRDLLDEKGRKGSGGWHVMAVAGSERVHVDVMDLEGRTALHVAGEVGDGRVVRLLVEKGARMDIKDRFGRLPMGRPLAGWGARGRKGNGRGGRRF